MMESEGDRLVAGYPENELIAGFRRRDPKAIHVIYELHFVKLCDWCYYVVGNVFDAQDIVSDIFEKLLTGHDGNKPIGASFNSLDDIANYLYVAAKNKCFTFLERSKRKQQVHQTLIKEDMRDYTVNDELDFEYARGLADLKLLETIHHLPQRSILVLRKIYLEDLSYEEIAKEMGISRATVSNLRQQGINILAKILNREDFSSHLLMITIISLSVI